MVLILSVLALACVRPPALPEASDPMQDLKDLASTLRGLPFLEPVRVEWIGSEQIPEIARTEVEEVFDPEYVTAYRDAYAALGLLPADIDLLETVLALQEEQLVGLYSVARKTLYVVVKRPGEQGPPMIIVHELVHALQHQHFARTVVILQGLQHNDDVVSALSAAVEGDASLTMLAVDENFAADRSVETAEQFRNAMLVDLEFPTGVLAEVPRLLRISLIAPYAYGVVLAAERFTEEGTAGLDALIGDPPLSTVPFLFPGAEESVDFVRLPLSWIESEVEPLGCELGHHNVAGALTLRVFFEEFAPGLDGDPFLRAWRGDRFLHLRCPQGSRVIWLLRWKDGKAARSFAEAYRGSSRLVAERADLPAVPEVVVAGVSTVVVSPSLRPLVPELIERAEIRPYASFSRWVEEGCFPEAGCPEAEPSPAFAILREDAPVAQLDRAGDF